MLKLESKGWVLPASLSSSVLILVLDAFTPIGFGDYIFYFIPIALSVFHRTPQLPLAMALLCSVLSCIGFILSPASGFNLEVAVINRAFTIFVQWAVAFLVKQVIVNRNRLLETTWLQNGANQLAEKIRGEQSPKELCDQILTLFARKTGFKVGAIFLKRESDDLFEFTAGYALSHESKNPISPGEGLLGQAAVHDEVTLISDLKDTHLKISSGTGESKAITLALVPLVADGQVIGLMELGFIKGPPQVFIDYLTHSREACAIAIRSARVKHKLAELLVESQKHAEELQAQQEELRVVNEELDLQTKALRESHVRLENQQAELEQTNQQLEEQAQELEGQKNLLNERNRELESKTEELRRSSNYKSEFLANMSHELRTPLNSTLILAKLLSENKKGNLDKEQVEYAEIIYNSGNDLLNLINDILDLSKVEAGKMTVAPEVVYAASVVRSLEQTFRVLAQQKELDFKVEVSPDLPEEFITDRQRLEQILKNFLSNAFKFTERGGVSLHVFGTSKEISFAVADTGVGMTPEEQQVIFEAFRQADGTINRKFGGTGLGLSISKEFAQLLGGEIQVSSLKGQGSTFTLKLPLKHGEKVHERPIPLLAHPAPAPAPAPETTKRSPKIFIQDDRDNLEKYARKMLIIEDDLAFAKILYDLAHEMNFGALVADSGEEGMRLAQEYRPNAIVLDIRLPDHNGMIVLDQLKINTRTRHIPVHIISSEDFSRSALEMGAIGYMLKPVEKEQLQSAFQNMTSVLEQELKHVLVVEDDAVQRLHIAQLIGDVNVEVTAVETSSEALRLLSEKTFDCMIMDLSLPDFSGHELLSKLSNNSTTYSFPPVIIYTARDLTPEEEHKLRLYSGSIIIKGAKSPERLLSEVTLFLHKVETDLPPERQRMLSELRGREKNLEERTVMVVDDDVRNIFAMTAALEGQGARVVTARNGIEALKKLSPSIDLVLMDIMMPEMDGHEAIRLIRNDEINSDIPIIALTAKTMKDDKQKCLEAGANDYLSKPIEMEKLLSLIRVWLPHKRRFL